MTLDISGDPILRTFPFETGLLVVFFQGLISVLIMLFLLAFGLKIPRQIKFLGPFLLIISVLLLGFINGLILNTVRFAISEVIPFLFFLSFLAFCSLKSPISVKELERSFTILTYLILGKFILYSILTDFLSGSFSWRVLLKQSFALLVPLSYFLSRVNINKVTKANYITLTALFIIITFGMSRMLFVGIIFLLFVHFFNRQFYKSLHIMLLICISFYMYQLMIGSSLGGIVEFIYGGSAYEDSLNYRLVQLKVISNRLEVAPLLGVGFGYFTPGYLDYSLLSKPYLLELDFLNFISKIGILGSIAYTISYFLLYRLIGLIACPEVRNTSLALFWGVVGLIIYSIGQTAHQSYLYWVILAFVYGFVVSHLRSQAVLSSNHVE